MLVSGIDIDGSGTQLGAARFRNFADGYEIESIACRTSEKVSMVGQVFGQMLLFAASNTPYYRVQCFRQTLNTL